MQKICYTHLLYQNKVIKTMENKKQAFTTKYYTSTIKKISKQLVDIYTQKGYTIATAESLTGGAISAAITSVPGVTSVFGLGICTYRAKMKENFFHLENELKESGTAVAKDIAIGMADGVRKLATSTIGIGTTGLAGPTDDGINPVGTVYIAVAWENGCRVTKLELGDIGRDAIRNQTIIKALQMAIEEAHRL